MVDLDGDLSGPVFIVPVFDGASSLPISAIVDAGAIFVDKKTIGQFTGTLDKHGRKIFEGDICRIADSIYKAEFVYFGWVFTILSKQCTASRALTPTVSARCEVIGNIYDNPELLEGEEKEGVHE